VVPEAPLEPAGQGRAPGGPGWFVLNARDARWREGAFGAFTPFEAEGELRFPQVGINIAVLQPGEPSCLYHREDAQEDFLVLYGECLLLIEGEERRLKAWDFVHCPAWTEHVFVGAGEGPCALVGVGSRAVGAVVYPVSELAQRHRAGAATETDKPQEAYADFPGDTEVACRDEWLPRTSPRARP
jgi:uncharacterized cupin superfamily protein